MIFRFKKNILGFKKKIRINFQEENNNKKIQYHPISWKRG